MPGGESLVLRASPEEWDAARRCADAVNVHVAVYKEHLAQGRERPGFVAIYLDDGRPASNDLYDTRRDATRHCPPFPRGVMYVKIRPTLMTPRMALAILHQHRHAFRKGVVFTEEELVVPHRLEDLYGQIPGNFLHIPRTFLGGTHGRI